MPISNNFEAADLFGYARYSSPCWFIFIGVYEHLLDSESRRASFLLTFHGPILSR